MPGRALCILFINSIQMFGGGEIWMLTAMQGLAERGHQVGGIGRPGQEWLKRSEHLGYPAFPIPIRGDLDPVTMFRFLHAIRRFQADILVTNMDKELRLAGLVKQFLPDLVLIPRRGIDYPLKNHLLYRLSYQKWADGVIANSQATRAALLQNAPWLPAEKVRVIYNGVQVNRFNRDPGELRERLQIPAKEFVFGFVGQLDERKGLRTLLPAFARLSLTTRNIRLLLAGEGPLHKEIEQFTTRYQLTDKISVLGFYEDIPEFMAGIDALVLPSLWEGFGIVLIEAMAAAKPVIATRTSNIPEIVKEGKVGWLVPAGDEEGLADAMHRLATHPQSGREMGQAGREWVKQKFTLSRMIDELEEYFYSLIECKNERRNRR